MKYFTFLIIFLVLSGCEGTDLIPSDDGDATLEFTTAELNQKIFFSEEIRNNDVEDGFILRFVNTVELEQIVLNNGNNALAGDYDWNIVNDKLQVTYPSSIVCTTTKTEDNNIDFDTSASCSRGNPQNSEIIEDKLIKPLSFSRTNLSNKVISIDISSNQQEVLRFNNEATTFTITERNNGQSGSPENGTAIQSNFTNVVRLDFSSANQYSLLVLLEGSLSNGSILDLRYNSNSDELTEIRIYSSNSNDDWNVEELFDSINIERT